MWTLALRNRSDVPLELDGIAPERLSPLSQGEVGRLPVWHGNRTVELGECFRIARRADEHDLVVEGDCSNVKGIGAGMAAGTMRVVGSTGPHAGAGMAGGYLEIEGNAGDWLGAEMKGGTIRVRGRAGHRVGAAYVGGRRGMTGGRIDIEGDAGDEVGSLMRRGAVWVGGRCGDFAGAGMIAGSLFIGGEVGVRLGAGMKRGTIAAARPPVEFPTSFLRVCSYRPTFLSLYGPAAPGEERPAFESLRRDEMDCYRGDLMTGGRGELLVPRSARAP